jgi:hypothetical protein
VTVSFDGTTQYTSLHRAKTEIQNGSTVKRRFALPRRAGKTDGISRSGLREDHAREERVALLEHHASQMQAYKIYVLTLVAGFFAVLQSFSALGLSTRDTNTLVWSAGGVVLAGSFFSLTRFMWYGTMVSHTMITPFEIDQNSSSPLMAQIQTRITVATLADARGQTEDGRKLNRMLRWMILLGYHRGKLFACLLALLVIFVAAISF